MSPLSTYLDPDVINFLISSGKFLALTLLFIGWGYVFSYPICNLGEKLLEEMKALRAALKEHPPTPPNVFDMLSSSPPKAYAERTGEHGQLAIDLKCDQCEQSGNLISPSSDVTFEHLKHAARQMGWAIHETPDKECYCPECVDRYPSLAEKGKDDA